MGGGVKGCNVDNGHFSDAHPITLADILDVVSARFCVSRIDLESKRRERRVAWARQCYCLLARELTDKSYHQIAVKIGNRDHTTIMHAIKAARDRVETDEAYAEHYRQCMRHFGRLV